MGCLALRAGTRFAAPEFLMAVQRWTTSTFLAMTTSSPCVLVSIAPGDGHFDVTLEQRLRVHRPGIALGTVDRATYDPNDAAHGAFLSKVLDRQGWHRSINIPGDGYYLFVDGAYVAFHPLLAEDA